MCPQPCPVLLLAAALALGPIAEGAEPAADPYVRMPWHLVDLWWDAGRETPFESYSLDVTFDVDVSPDVRLYVAPLGLAHLSGTPVYGGIQTRSDGHTRADSRVRELGPGLLMSMWNERSLDAIRPALGGFCQSSGHEGDFVSVRRPYAWRRGTYTYRVVRMDEETIEGRPYTWVGAFLHAHGPDEHVFIGALRFPGHDLVLSRKLASFVEVYGPRRPVEEIPRVKVTFSRPRINGVEVERPPVEAIYPKGVPDYAEAVATPAGVVVTVGQPVEGRIERQFRLTWPEAEPATGR